MSEYVGTNPSKVKDFYGLVPTVTTTQTMRTLNAVRGETRYSVRAVAAALLEWATDKMGVAGITPIARTRAAKYDARYAHLTGDFKKPKRRTRKTSKKSGRK